MSVFQLLDGLINTLLGALNDNGLRIMCLRGLANIVGAGFEGKKEPSLELN